VGPAGVSVGRVTDGTAGDDAGGGLEGAAAKEESNVLAVPLLDMAATIATRNGSREQKQ
jgi:hypothetical protein